VLADEHVYGSQSGWMALEFMDPDKVAWDSRDKGVGGGSLVCADGMLYVVSETKGEVGLLEASPKDYSEKGSFTLPERSKLRKTNGGVWTHPVVANGRLYLRDQDLIFCYDVKGK
jgi:hypothetical protein